MDASAWYAGLRSKWMPPPLPPQSGEVLKNSGEELLAVPGFIPLKDPLFFTYSTTLPFTQSPGNHKIIFVISIDFLYPEFI